MGKENPILTGNHVCKALVHSQTNFYSLVSLCSLRSCCLYDISPHSICFHNFFFQYNLEFIAVFKWIQVPIPSNSWSGFCRSWFKEEPNSHCDIFVQSCYANTTRWRGARRCCSALESKTLDYLLPAGSQTVTEGVNSKNIRLWAV